MKLWRARPRLYRRQFSQPRTRRKALTGFTRVCVTRSTISVNFVSKCSQVILFFFRKQIRILFFGFSSYSVNFRGARLFLTSKSNSSRFFALDGQIFRSVRPLELILKFFTVRMSTCGGKARVTEIPGGRSPPDPPRWARHG